MKNGITNRDTSSGNADNLRDSGHVPVFIVIAVVLLAVFALGVNVAFINQSWLDARYTALLMMSFILLLGTVAAQQKEKYPPPQRETAACDHDDIAHQLSWEALRPYARGESRNCKVSQRSTSSRLLFSPIFSFQYTALILAAAILVCLITTTLSASLPQILQRGVAATSDPVLTTFICLLSFAVTGYVACLLRTPVRSLEFNKAQSVFWIEKYRVFGWKVGESAQMPISQIHALQVLSFSKHGAIQPELKQRESKQGDSDRPGIVPDCPEQERNKHLVRDYEVNVVFRNGERVNIISHRNCRAIQHDTDRLASFLGVPIWDKPPATKRV